MIVTETEAQTKWCPLAKAQREEQSFASAVLGNHAAQVARCKASDCMLWTWVDGYEEKGRCGLGRV